MQPADELVAGLGVGAGAGDFQGSDHSADEQRA
jgi:hypothetical protein